MPQLLAVIRLRGSRGVGGDVEETLSMLHLRRRFHATIIDDRSPYLGMLRVAENYITWGEVDKQTLALMLKKRGCLKGRRKLTDKYVEERTGFKSIDEYAEALYNFKASFRDLPDLKPVFRLRPPRKGFKGSIKRPYKDGGELGYRGEAVNKLIKRMV